MLIETSAPVSVDDLQKSAPFTSVLPQKDYTLTGISQLFRQQLTHQTIHSQFITIRITQPVHLPEYLTIPRDELDNYAFPKTITTFLQSKNLSLF
jgi:A/G-specific adenine glycosylase